MTRAITWREQMPEAPKLVHDNGMVLVQLGERSVVFPSEAAARFFHAAYTDVPALETSNAVLRTQLDDEALSKASARIETLEAEAARMQAELTTLREQLSTFAGRAADANQRAKILADALRKAVKP